MIVQELHGGIAEPALGHIDDALEGEIVGRRIDDAQIGECVADLGALVELRAADHAVVQAERDEAVLEFAHLERGADENRDVVEGVRFARFIRALELLDLLADGAGFLLGIPGAGDGDLFAKFVVGAQRLAEPAFVMGDQVRGGGEDVAGGAVVALEPDHRGAGKVVLEAQDVVDLGAAPAVDRLVVVADAADVFGGLRLPLPACGERVGVRGRRRGLGARGHKLRQLRRPLIRRASRVDFSPRAGRSALCPLRQQPQPQILCHVGVLILVDQDEFEARLILAQHFGLLAEQPDAFQQQIAEVAGVENLQPLLERLVEFQPLAVGEG